MWSVGTDVITLPGLPGGNSVVTARVHYPATTAGVSTPVEPGGAPYPLVIFGHSEGVPAHTYDSLAVHRASHGFITLSLTTEAGSTPDVGVFRTDMIAAAEEFRLLSSNSSSPFLGATNSTDKVVFMGHGFGGAAASIAAIDRPDLAVVLVTFGSYGTGYQGYNLPTMLAGLLIPALHLSGSEDLLVPSQPNLDLLFNVPASTGRAIEILGGNGSSFHEGYWYDRALEPPPSIGLAEQQRLTRLYSLAFLDWQIKDSSAQLYELLGPQVEMEPEISRAMLRLRQAVLFADDPVMPGDTVHVYAGRQQGDTAYVGAALGLSPQVTVYGISYLDPATRVICPPIQVGSNSLSSLEVLVAPDPALSGVTIPCQAFIGNAQEARLSNLLLIQIF